MEAGGAPEFPLKMRVTTLLFHDVVPAGRPESSGFLGAGADVYKLDLEEFRRHLEAVRQTLRGEMATGPEVLAGSFADRGDDPVLLTFDDGGASAHLHVADMLDENGWKAHFLVTTGRVGTAGFLDKAQIRDLRRRGHVIGSHSHTHPARMSHCSPKEMDDEWRRSTGALAEILGEPVDVASVPGGFYSRKVALAAAGAGIRLLFNSEPVRRPQTVQGCLILGRYTAKRGYPGRWSAAILAGSRGLRTREFLFWNVKKLAKAVLGGAWLRARAVLLEGAHGAASNAVPPDGGDPHATGSDDGPR